MVTFIMIDLSNKKKSLTKEEIKILKSVTWDSIEKYLLKPKKKKKNEIIC